MAVYVDTRSMFSKKNATHVVAAAKHHKQEGVSAAPFITQTTENLRI
jgi:hypothetical protein